jgi:hypothetical protein
MSECFYFLKAEFPNKEKATKAREELNKFFAQAREAYYFWQETPECNRAVIMKIVMNSRGRHTGKNFMKDLKKKYPLVAEYGEINGFKCYDDFSRNLNLCITEDNEVRQVDNILGWSEEVSHMASWGPLCNFIQKKHGAVRTVWKTEEDGCGSLDSLQLYDYEGIVTELMKHEELFPLIIGIHEELNAMIDIKIKERRS